MQLASTERNLSFLTTAVLASALSMPPSTVFATPADEIFDAEYRGNGGYSNDAYLAGFRNFSDELAHDAGVDIGYDPDDDDEDDDDLEDLEEDDDDDDDDYEDDDDEDEDEDDLEDDDIPY